MPVAPKQIRFGPFLLDTQCDQLRRDSIGIRLQGQPVQILAMLLERPGELVTREDIRQRLWSTHTFVDFDHGLNTAVKKLRHVLEDDADAPRYIETVPKHGYRFIGQINSDGTTAHSGLRETASDDLVANIAGTLAFAAISAEEKRKALRMWSVIALSVMGLFVFGVVIHWTMQPTPMPHVVGSHVLTGTGYPKWSAFSRLLTDGQSIYFQESRPSGLATMRVSVHGGEVSTVTVANLFNTVLRDIRTDPPELLYSIQLSANRSEAMVQPLPAGPPRVVRDARWPIWTPDGRLLFTRNHALYRSNSDGSDAHRLARLPDITDLETSPDGRRIRFGVAPSDSIWEAEADGSRPHQVLREQRNLSRGTWSTNGEYYFFGVWDGERDNIWSVADERHWWTLRKSMPIQLTFGPFSASVPAISKDGKQFYTILKTPRGELSVYDSGSHQFLPYLGGIAACHVDFSRDSEWIAYVSYPEGNLWRSRVNGTERRQLTIPPYAVMNPRWSPDGRFIAFTELSGDGQIYLISAEGGAPLLVGSEPGIHDATWSPDSAAIAYGAGGESMEGFWGIKILDLQTEKSSMVPGSEKLHSPRWSPDGKHLLALHGSPATKLMLFTFSTQTWKELASGTLLGWPSWSRDSKQIVLADLTDGGLFRITVPDGKKEQIASLSTFRAVAFRQQAWFGITPDGRPMSTRDISTEEIYAFDLEYK